MAIQHNFLPNKSKFPISLRPYLPKKFPLILNFHIITQIPHNTFLDVTLQQSPLQNLSFFNVNLVVLNVDDQCVNMRKLFNDLSYPFVVLISVFRVPPVSVPVEVGQIANEKTCYRYCK